MAPSASNVRTIDLNKVGLPWIGVDLDATLAEYDVWKGIEHIGKPIAPMVQQVQKWLNDGHQVKIFTARVARPEPERSKIVRIIQDWLENSAGLPRLEVTCVKDMHMFQLYDDRCVQIVPNMGVPVYTKMTAWCKCTEHCKTQGE